MRRVDQCFACSRVVCKVRIWTEEGDFDEVACPAHVRDLESFADAILGERPRWHSTSSERQVRGVVSVKVGRIRKNSEDAESES